MRWNIEKLHKVGALAVAALMLASVAIAQERPRLRQLRRERRQQSPIGSRPTNPLRGPTTTV